MQKALILLKNYFTQIIGSIIGLLFTVVASNKMSTFEYGELKTAMYLISFLMVFTLPGFDQYILRNAKSFKLKSVFSILFFRIKLGLFFFLIIEFLLAYFKHLFSYELFLYIKIIVFFLPLMDLIGVFKNYFIGLGLHRQGIFLFGIYRALNLFFFVIGTFIFMFLNVNPLLIIIFYLSSIISFLIIAINLFKKKKYTFKNISSKKLNYKPAIYITFSGLILMVTYLLDKFTIRSLFGVEQFGLYSVLFLFPNEILRIIDLSFPFFYRDFNKLKIDITIIIYLLILGIFYVLFFYSFSSLVFGEQYNFDVELIIISLIFIFGGVLEYYFFHKIFLRFFKKPQLNSYLINFILTSLVCFFSYKYKEYLSFDLFLVILCFKQLLLILILNFYHGYLVKKRNKIQ